MRAFAVAVTILVAVTGILNRDLWNPHEHRDGAIALEMARSGDWVVPTLAGRPFLEKPPLTYAAGALLTRLLGTEPARTIRSASALFALGTLLCMHAIARSLGLGREAWVVPGLLVTTLGFYVCGHFIVTDAGLTFFTTLAYLGLAKLVFDGKAWGRDLLWAAVAGAILCKGPVGCVLPFAGLLAFALLTRDAGVLRRVPSIRSIALFAALLALWVVPLARRDGGVHLQAWWRQNVDRFVGPTANRLHHEQNSFYYLYAFPYVCLPWSFAWPFALRRWYASGRRSPNREARFLLAWLGSGLVMLSAAVTKRDLYAYPLIVPIVLLHTRFLIEWATTCSARVVASVVAALAIASAAISLAAQATGTIARPGWVITIVAGGGFALTAAIVIRMARAHGPFAMVAAPALLVAQLNTLAVPVMDAALSWRQPVANLVRRMPPGSSVVSWKLGESLSGAFSFYGERTFEDFARVPPLRDHLRRHAGALVVATLDRFEQVGLAKRLAPVATEAFGDVTVGLYRSRR